VVSPASVNKRPHLGGVTSTLLVSHPHLPFFIGARNEKTLDVFHFGSRDAVSTFHHSPTEGDCVTSVDFSLNGRFIAVGSTKGRLSCWKFSSVMEKKEPLFSENILSRITAVRFLGCQSGVFAVGGTDSSTGEAKNVLKVLDAYFRGHAAHVVQLPIRPDYVESNFENPSEVLVCSTKGEYVIYNLATNLLSEQKNIIDPSKKTTVTSFTSSPYDPGFVAFGTSKSEIALCSITTDSDGTRALSLRASACASQANRISITDVKFSPSAIVMCCGDGKVLSAPLIPEGVRDLLM
jgi:WD40 repeat protein